MSTGPETAIQIENLSKMYRIPSSGHRSFLGSSSLMVNAFLGKEDAVPSGFYPFYALNPVTLNIAKGESVGIIGRNGSGKSTLLQLVAGTLSPTSGSVSLNGSVSALLELGSGFALEYTGMENIFLNGAILGLKKEYLEEKLDEILAFAEIGEFIHQPIKTYSSGMRVRLAFAVLATVRPEILIIDEALSVGDTFFQSKCARWLESYVQDGGCLLCVSHDMFMLQRLCDRGIVLDKGEVLLDGPIAQAATLYFKLQQKEKPAKKSEPETTDAEDEVPLAGGQKDGKGMIPVDFRTSERTGSRALEILSIKTSEDLLKDCFVGDWMKFEVEFLANENVDETEFGIGFRDRSGQFVTGFHSHFSDIKIRALERGKRYSLSVNVHLMIKPRDYLLIVGFGIILGEDRWVDHDTLWDCSQVIIHGERRFWGLAPMPHETFSLKPIETNPVESS
ncbi:MAG: ABC transporter ATP-binding protein [Puniceicoccaceae bacterium]